MNKKRALIFMTALLCLLAGCMLRATSSIAEIPVYRLNTDSGSADGKLLAAENVAIRENETAVEAAVRALNSDSTGEKLEKAFPEGVRITSWYLEKGTAFLEMSPAYMELEGMERLLADYAAVCTLTDIDNILSVNIICKEKTVERGLTANDILVADAGYTGDATQIKLFVPDFEKGRLVCSSVSFSDDGKTELAERAVRELIAKMPHLPEQTRLLSVRTENGICTVNLSGEFYITEPERALNARLVIYAFVDTLTYLPDIDGIVIKVGGTQISSYGSFLTAWPMSFDSGLIDFG